MKILIVRFSSIGDIVLTTPVVRALKEQLKNVELHFITKKGFVPLLTHNPHITKIHAIDKSVDEVMSDLKNEKFDLIIDLHKNIRTLSLKKKLGVKAYSFRKLNFQKWLLVNFKKNNMPKLHIVDRYFEAVKELGVNNDQNGCELFIDALQEVNTKEKLNVDPKSFVSIAIGAQFNTKILPVDKLIEIVNGIKSPVVLLGGPTDIERAKEIMEGVSEASKSNVYNAVGKFSLMESASIVKQSNKLLTHDTGLMHIATCFNVPIISVWGNTVPVLGMYPYYPKNEELFELHEVENLSCRPCSKIGYNSCPKKHFNCMTLQDTVAITKSVNKN